MMMFYKSRNSATLACIFIALLYVSCKNQHVVSVKEEILPESLSENYRNKFHFSPDSMWMNDPNGMFFYEGEYHLFYQYYPDSTVWGPMHWGHAISKDMINWEDLPIALYPDSLGYIFSGSAVVDHHNSSGFGSVDSPPIVAIFTHHDPVKALNEESNDFQYQSIAYSIDRGRSWVKYEGNPVVENPGIRDFRDPKVIWVEKDQEWVMVFAAKDKVRFYGSSDLKEWTFKSEWGDGMGNHGGVWECPDLFPLKIEGQEDEKWILLVSINPGGPNGGSATQYFIGDWNGTTFEIDEGYAAKVKEENAVWLDYGKDNYAGVTWSNIPAEDGRKLFIGWMSNWQYAQVVPSENWRSAMTIPRVLSLHYDGEQYFVASKVVDELRQLESEFNTIEKVTFTADTIIARNELGLWNCHFEFEKGNAETLAVRFSNDIGEYIDVGYFSSSNIYFVDRTHSGESAFSEDFADFHTAEIEYMPGPINLNILVDAGCVEVFADQGRTVMTEIFFTEKPYTNVSILADQNDIKLLKAKIATLKPAKT